MSRWFVLLSLLGSAFGPLGAKTTVFVGRPDAEDGHLFSVAENWTAGVPATGDSVVVSSTVARVVNDLPENTRFNRLDVKKNASVDFPSTLVGKPVTLTSYYLWNGCRSSLAVTGKGSFYLGGAGNGAADGPITTPSDCLLYIDNEKSIYLYAPLRVGGVFKSNSNSSYKNGNLYLCSTGNWFNASQVWYNKIYFRAPHAVDPEFVINWGNTNKENNRGVYDFGAYDQTANRITGTSTRTTGCQIRGSGVLTLKGTADALSPCLIENSLSVVWMPTGNYTQTFTNRAHTTTGSLTVSNGTMRLAKGGSFANVKKILVAEGATFDLATPTAGTLAALEDLVVDGTFRFAEGAASPFTPSKLHVTLGLDGKLEIPEGVTLDLPQLFVRGVYLKAGTYAAEDWIVGGGSVRVENEGVRSWRAPIAGAWADATKWEQGTVPATEPTTLTAEGANYDVAFDSGLLTPQSVTVGNASGFVTRLLLGAGTHLSAEAPSALTVADGGLVEIPRGTVAFTNGTTRLVTVSGTGEWRVSGGTNTIHTGEWGGFHVAKGGLLSVTAGVFRAKNVRLGYAPGLTISRGRIHVGGTGRVVSENGSGEFNPLGSGEVVLSGQANMYLAKAFAGPSQADAPLSIVVTNTASLTTESGLFFGDTATGGETTIDVHDGATVDFGWKCGIGLNRACRATLTLHPGATAIVHHYGATIGGLVVKKDSLVASPTGLVAVAGGRFTVEASYYGRNEFLGKNSYQGMLIASPDPTSTAFTGETRYSGELSVTAGGVYDQKKGYLSVGVGLGDGKVVVDQATALKSGGGEILFGACGGTGTLDVRGGASVSFAAPLFAGGFDPAALAIPRTWSDLDHATVASTGCVRVVDGTLAVDGPMTFGQKGTGELLVGEKGLVTADTLTLSNNVASRLSFVFGAGGAGAVRLSGPLVIAQGAALHVDASAYQGQRGFFRLVEASSVEGAFDPAKVEVTGLKGLTYRLDAKGLAVARAMGTYLLVR
jgi:hypothetical protein